MTTTTSIPENVEFLTYNEDPTRVEGGGTKTVDEWGSTYYRDQTGTYHRVDGPAIEHTNGDREWYVNGQRHRTDGPAVDWSNGYQEWWQNGRRHRTDGPALILTNGEQQWWVDGKRRVNPATN